MQNWKDETNRINESRRQFVRDYLKEKGVSPALAGYKALLFTILKAGDEPSLTSQELFNCYAEEELKRNEKSAATGAYKNAHVAVKKSLSPTMTVFEFIKECSIQLE